MDSSSGLKLETILVVDDNAGVLGVVSAILENARFRVLQATSGDGALRLAANYKGTIHLLLSDVQMPEMTGPDLGDALKRLRPDLRVMLMSAMAGGDLLVLNYGWAFIQKPFLMERLLKMIDSVLHTPDRSQGNHEFISNEDSATARIGQVVLGRDEV